MTAVGVLYAPLAMALVPLIAAPFLVGVVAILFGLRRAPESHADINAPKNPLQFGAALQMAMLFQVVLFLVEGVRAAWGDVGLVVSGAILGLADVDALMISMARTASVSGAVARSGARRGRGHPLEHAAQAGAVDVGRARAVPLRGRRGALGDGRRIPGGHPPVPLDGAARLTSHRRAH